MSTSTSRSRSGIRSLSRKIRSRNTPYGLEPLELRQLLTTYYVATNGNDNAAGGSSSPFLTLQQGVSVLHAGDTLTVRSGTYQGFVVGYDVGGIYGPIAGTSTAPITIQADPAAPAGSVVINDQSNKEADAITIEGQYACSWLVIKGLTINNNSGLIPRDGIRVVESDNVTILNCEVTGAQRFGIFTTFSTSLVIQGCNIHDNLGNGDGTSGHGIYISNGSVNPVIRGNLIARSGSQGIHVNGDVSNGGAGIITGALIENNVIANNINNGINCDGIVNSRIQNNLIYGSTKHGISLYMITALAGSTGNVIVNNTIDDTGGGGAAIQLALGSTGNTVYNNVLLGGSDGTFSVSDDSRSGLVSDYNAVSDRYTNYDTDAASSLAQWRSSSGQDAHSFVSSASTLFVNSAGGNYHLKTGSPAINTGTSMTKAPPTTDLDGLSRPSGGAYDIGAYEFGTTSNDTTPPVLSAITSGSLTTTGATITWTSNESSDSQVEYGTSTSYGTSTTISGVLVVNHSVVLSGLTAGTLYHYRVKSKDASGNLTVSADFTLTTAAPDVTPPTISSVTNSTPTLTASTITWTTNEASDSQVEYGTSTSYGTSTTLDTSLATSHSVALTGLTAGTVYHYRVKSRDASGNLAVSGDFTFTTAAPDVTPPTISAVTSINLTTTGATITWTTNEAADTQVEYGLTSSYGSNTTLTSTKVTSHSKNITGLTAGTVYHYRVKSKDASGNLAVSGDFTFTTKTVDTTAPTASLTSSNVTSGGAATYTFTVTFADNVAINVSTLGSTDINVTGPGGFSQNATFVSVDTNSNGTPRTATYRINTPGGTWDIADNGTYTISVVASQVADTSGNFVAAGALGTFSVSISDVTAPVLSAIGSSALTTSSATVAWTTDESADTQVEYGTSTSYGSMTTLDTSMATSHSVSVTGLQAGTLYHYRVMSRDSGGNLAVSGDFTFTTAVADVTAPTAVLHASNVTTSGGTTYTFTVTFTDNVAVKVSTLGSTDLLVTGPAGFNQAATFVSVNTNTNGTVRTATYRINAPGGSWDITNNGRYTVSMNSGEVTDTSSNPVVAGIVGTFAVSIADTAAPTATLTVSDVVSSDNSTYTFTVTFSDDNSVNVSTIGSTNIVVTGPNGFSQLATFVSVDDNTNGTPRTATYQITAAGGNWDDTDNGSYTISMVAGEVSDLSGNFVAGGALGSFTVTIAPNTAPVGYIDTAGPTNLTGWAYDADVSTASLTLGLVVDGVFYGRSTADRTRNDLVSVVGSANHGYSFDLSGLSVGLHRADLYAFDANTGASVYLCSKEVNTNRLATGWLDVLNASTISGWAADSNTATTSIQIRYVIDNNAPVVATASRARTDLTAVLGSSNHGFSCTLPQLAAGTHTISVYAIDSTTLEQFLIGSRSVSVAGPTGNVLPVGNAEVVSTTRVSGWAMDMTSKGASIYVRVDVDGATGTPFLANLLRRDVSKVMKVNGNFGFSKALALSAGEHRIDVYALDSTTLQPVLLASRLVGSTAPQGSIDVATSSVIAGWAYSSALSGVSSTIRIDVDGVAGNTLVANRTRNDLISYFGAANYGYSATLPGMTFGTHVVTLTIIDPYTLAGTTLATASVVVNS